MIYFNQPYYTGREIEYIKEAFSKQTSGNGYFTKKCHEFFQDRYGFKKVLLTTSCTDALEMAALLTDIRPGDEVIIPSFTFVSTANPFILRGAKIVFCDSLENNPNIDPDAIESLITSRTKALVIVHYAGIACDMEKIMKIASKHDLYLVEDAAHAVDSYYNGKPLGSFGHFACFSFHETKNIVAGECGLLVINDERFMNKAEIIWEKGTNRSAFLRGEVDKYGWVSVGSSFLPSEIIAACLLAQLENIDLIQNRRKYLWNLYFTSLTKAESASTFYLPDCPLSSTNNAHMFYLVCGDLESRCDLIAHLKEEKIQALFHYLSLHNSKYYREKHDGRVLKNSGKFTDCLVRLPFYVNLQEEQISYISSSIKRFFLKKSI